MASHPDPALDMPNPRPPRPSTGERWYRRLDGSGGLLLLIGGLLCLCSSLGPHQRGPFLVSLAMVLTTLLDLRRWVFEGSRRLALPRRWRIVLWVPVFVLFLAGGLLWQLGY